MEEKKKEMQCVHLTPDMFFCVCEKLWSKQIRADTDCLIVLYEPDLEVGTFEFGLMFPNEEVSSDGVV